MGIYIFTTTVLKDVIIHDAGRDDSRHDIGDNIIPAPVDQGLAATFNFGAHRVPGQSDREQGYWRNVSTLDAYYAASMDLVVLDPVFSLYNEEWPILA